MMKKIYSHIIFSIIILTNIYAQNNDTTLVFSNNRIGKIILNGSITNIDYKLIDSEIHENYFTKLFAITDSCNVLVFYSVFGNIIGLETDCEKISLESGIKVGKRVYEIKSLDSSYHLGLGERFGFHKYVNDVNGYYISLLLGEVTVNEYWKSYSLNPDKYDNMEDYLDRNACIKRIRIFVKQW